MATTAPTPTTAVPVTNPCALGPQSPPVGPVTASNATALAFAPDGRLFFAERTGAVRVFQDGAVKEFAKVPADNPFGAGNPARHGDEGS